MFKTVNKPIVEGISCIWAVTCRLTIGRREPPHILESLNENSVNIRLFPQDMTEVRGNCPIAKLRVDSNSAHRGLCRRFNDSALAVDDRSRSTNATLHRDVQQLKKISP